MTSSIHDYPALAARLRAITGASWYPTNAPEGTTDFHTRATVGCTGQYDWLPISDRALAWLNKHFGYMIRTEKR